MIYRFQFQRKTGPFFLGDTAQPYTVTRIAKGKSTVVARGHDAAEQHRQALDAGLPEPRHEVDRLVRRRRREGVRRSARRPVLRRHRRDLRPRRDPQGHRQHGRRQGLLRRLRRAHVRACRFRSRSSRAKNGTIGVWASVDRRKVTTRGATTRERGRLGAGRPAREPARQRGDHPDRPQGPVERAAAVERVGVPQVLQRADPRGGDQQAVQARRSRDRP